VIAAGICNNTASVNTREGTSKQAIDARISTTISPMAEWKIIDKWQ
jgi:hypothetical protein